MNTRVFLFLGLLVFNAQLVVCSQVKEETCQESHNLASSTQSSSWLSKVSKIMLWAGIIGLGTIIDQNYFVNHNHLDPQRPFTCADIYHRFSDGRREMEEICAHTQEPFRQTKYEFVPKALRDQCSYPHYPNAPTWALRGEIESLRLSEKAFDEAPHTHFTLICRYSPSRKD